MLDLSLPWWEFVVRAAVVYVALLVMVRASGKRTIGQFTPFDLLVVLLLSESVSESLAGGDDSLGGGLLSALTLVALNALVGLVSALSPRAEKLIEGEAVLLGRNGQIYEHLLRRHRVGRADIDRALREADCSLKDMRCIFLEPDGDLSVLQRKSDN